MATISSRSIINISMNNSFKTFFKKTPSKSKVDQSISDKILDICKYMYEQDNQQDPELLLDNAINVFLENAITELKTKIIDSRLYIFDEVKQKYPQKINTEKEDFKNEPIEKNSRTSRQEKA